MKHFIFNSLIALSLLAHPVMADTQLFGDAHSAAGIQPYSGEYSYSIHSPIRIETNGFTLVADSGSLMHDLTISATVLSYKKGTAMPSHMESVCLLSDGMRLLPNGEHFSKEAPALVTLAYDPSRVPMGYAPKDIYTYYCEDAKTWHRLERVSVDTIAHTITSRTTHFTDFANAVIKIPEMPENKAFVPTDMQDLPDPDPLVGIPMIAVPQANNMGTAELSYPIQLPPGRHGLQPDLDLHYSSAGGNGLLGVGWSISQPAVTVDTRWGVPRYYLGYETEAYLINGESFLLHDDSGNPIPLPHMASSFTPRSARATRFYARDQRNQSKAVRHGQSPSHYWWSVTTTDGVTYYYGYDPYMQTIDENSVLRTKEGNIGYWALTYVVDRFDNYMRYVNHKYSGNEIVIQRIEYTGNQHQNLPPYYQVGFTYKQRDDSLMDARLGLLRNQNYVLCQMYVLLGNETIPMTTYRFYYEYGEFSLHKSRLKSIAKVDGGIDDLAECGMPMDYAGLQLSDESWIRDEDVMYNEITHENIPSELKPGCLTQFSYADAFGASSLFGNSKTLVSTPANFSSSRSEGWNVGGDVTIGFGFNPAMTTFSAGANYSYSRSKGGVEATMIDLNGDGLLDRLVVSNHSVKYHRQLNDGTFAAPVTISGLDRLSREVSSSHTFGLQLDFAANLSYNPVISNSYTDVYFADINGDGLPDLITPEGVRINLLNSNDIPSFSPISDNVQGIEVHGNNCSKTITFDGQVDERLMCQLNYVCIDTLLLSELQPSDDGESDFIEQPMSQDDPEPDVPGTMDADPWTPLPIDEGHDAKHIAARIDTIELRPYLEKDKSIVSHASVKSSPAGIKSSATWEDILSAYYQGEDYSFKLINDTVFVFQKEFSCTKSSDEPNIDIVRVWVSDREDTLRINSRASLIPDTTFSRIQARNADGVRLRIQWNRNVQRQEDRLVADSVKMLYDHTIDADDYTPYSANYNISVQPGDVLFFRLSALDNRRFDDVDWEQTILSISGDTLYNSSQDYLCSGDQSFVAPATGLARISLSCSNEDTTSVVLSAKLGSTPILNRTVPAQSSLDTIFYANVVDSAHISFFADSLSSEPQWSKVHILPTVDYWGNLVVDTAGTGTTLPDTLHYYPDVHLQHTSFYSSDTCLYRRLFGPLHKGWGWFAYNDINRDSVISLQVLSNEEYMAADAAYAHAGAYHTDNAYTVLNDTSLSDMERKNIADSCFSAVPIYDPLADDKRWVAMHPDYPRNHYLAYGNTGSIGQKLHSVSRQLQEVRDSTIISEVIEEYDSPIPTLHGGMQRITTIRKSTHSAQHNISYGLSTPIGIGVSQNISFGSYNVTSDYMDLNGDGYPDFVGESAIQYSQPWGGIGSVGGKLPASFNNTNSSAGLGFSASRPRPEHVPSNKVTDSKMAFGGFGGGLNGQLGTDVTHTVLIDINADGLPDMVDADNQQVRYNLGYSFTNEPYSINSLSAAASVHRNASFSLAGNANFEQIWDVIQEEGNIKDYSLAQYSISGGFSSSTSQNQSTLRLIDINGDGYNDRLTEDSSGNIYVQYYNGTSFGTAQMLNAQNIQKSNTANIGFNLGVTAGFDLVLIPIKFCFGIQSSPWNVSSSYGTSDFMDVNGDGFVDQILNGDSLQVRYNRNGTQPVNLLTAVTNPTGQIITIGYELSEPSIKHRERTWNMANVEDKIFYGLDASDLHRYDFSYSNPFYDNYERTDYGYANVHTEDNQTYVLQEEYENRWYVNKGEKIGDLLLNEHHLPIIGHRHETRYYNSSDIPQTDVCDDIELHVGKNGYWTDYYEGEATPQVVTQYDKMYDIHHNLIHYADYGDAAINGDEWFQDIGYKSTTSYNMISLPNFERITDGGSTVLRQSRVKYNSFGKPFQIIRDDINQNLSAITALQYDAYGNLYLLRTPNNENNEWSWRRFYYDNATKTHVSKVHNQFGEYHNYEYDLRFGLRTYSLDPAGNKMYWRYDRMGRLIDIVAPNEIESNHPYSIHYIYRQPFHDFAENSLNPLLYPHVTKVAADGSTSKVDVTIYDARGQELQRKYWRCVNAQHVWVTDGWRYRDAWYRPLRTYDPFITNASLHPLWKPDTTSMDPYITYYEYDALNRVTYCQHPDMTDNLTTYHFDQDMAGYKRLLTENRDENGVIRKMLKAPQEWTIETKNLMDSSCTRYEYNPIGELMGVLDADNYHTLYDYDMFGNKIQRIHPDAGKTYWNYAPDGSLISVKTERMSGISDSIHYNYYFDKLMDIKYPRTPLNNVHYQYDIAGRMAYYEDGTGSTRLYYDRMGNVRLSERRILVPTESNVYTFRTRFTYDSFGRIQNMIYPDGDTVIYTYIASGELKDVSHIPQSGYSVTVATDLTYDVQGRNNFRRYGNTTWTSYLYEPLRNRLAHMRTISPRCELQDLYYDYDGVGNVLNIQQAYIDCYGLGGAYMNSYKYDCQNRLSGAYSTPNQFNYDFQPDYSPAGRFGHGFCSNMFIMPAKYEIYGYDETKETHQPRVIFDSGNNTHTQLFWDANGNLSQILNCKEEYARFHDWDDENRLRMVLDNTKAGFYGYDANGERVYKLTGTSSLLHKSDEDSEAYVMWDSVVLYPNPYMTITPNEYTKHFYMNGERLASSIGGGGWCSVSPDAISSSLTSHETELLNEWPKIYQEEYPFEYPQETMPSLTTNEDIFGQSSPDLQYVCPMRHLYTLNMNYKQDILWLVMHDFCLSSDDKNIYYRHSDHLGSANWITDQDGHAVQYLHYLPYGELLLNQQVAGYDERYKFTGKERDAESGYDYFGARYYASPLYNWTSVDPLTDKFPQISPYAYCNWNPIKFVDPDGKEIIVGTWYGRVLAKLGFNNYEAKVQSHLNELKAMDPQVNNMIINLENSENNHVIRHPKSKWNTAKPVNGEDFKNNKRQGSIVDYDPDNWETKNGDRRDPKAGLSHELQHSLDIDQGNGSIEKINDIPIMEIDAINMENKVRHQTGDTKRTTYGGKEIPNNMLD